MMEQGEVWSRGQVTVRPVTNSPDTFLNNEIVNISLAGQDTPPP